MLNFNINNYTANVNRSPKSYGSIEAGLEVIKFRRERMEYHAAQNTDYYAAADLVKIEIIDKFGAPQ